MKLSKKVVAGAGLVIAGTTLAVACRDLVVSQSQSSSKQVSVSRSVVTAHKTTAAELHAKNKLNWMGVTHNVLLDKMRTQLNAKTIGHLCQYMLSVIDSSDVQAATGGHYASNEARDQYKYWMGQSGFCAKKSPFKVAVGSGPARFGFASATLDPDTTGTGAYVDEINSALSTATDADNLASTLSTIYDDATSTLSDTAAMVIQGTIAVAQSSYEYWSDGSVFNSMVDSTYNAEYELCASGNDEGDELDNPGVGTLYCTEGRWRQASSPPTRALRPLTRFASLPMPRRSGCTLPTIKQALGAILGADGSAAAKTILTTWFAGPFSLAGSGAAAAGASGWVSLTIDAYIIWCDFAS